MDCLRIDVYTENARFYEMQFRGFKWTPQMDCCLCGGRGRKGVLRVPSQRNEEYTYMISRSTGFV